MTMSACRAVLPLAGLVLAASTPALADLPLFVPGQALVRLRPGFGVTQFNQRYGTATLRSIASRNIHLVSLPAAGDEEGFVDTVRLDPDVLRADVNFVFTDDPFGGGTQSFFLARDQFAYDGDPTATRIGLPEAQAAATGAGVLVAVLDSGVDAAHPMLAGRIAPGGFNFVGQNTNTNDVRDFVDSTANGIFDEQHGHGTFVAGLIARAAPGAKILPVRVLDSDGWAESFRVTQGVYHAVDAGARVINVSLGSREGATILEDAVAEARAAGALVVASAGNQGQQNPAFPAAFAPAGVLAVAAVDGADLRASFSNFGTLITVSAPGVSVLSLTPGGGFGEASGTSFAAPLVSGTLALIASACPFLTPDGLRSRLLGTTVFIDGLNPNFAGQLGTGRLDAAAALGIGDVLGCGVDRTGDGHVDLEDLYAQSRTPSDLNGDGEADAQDTALLERAIRKTDLSGASGGRP